jgi:hypothetical protein
MERQNLHVLGFENGGLRNNLTGVVKMDLSKC